MSGRGRGGRRGGGRGRRGGRRHGNLPGVCRHYSSPKGCVKDESCNFLHICRNLFDNEGCRFGKRCRYNHDFTADQPSEILEKHRIDSNQDFQELLDLLRPKVQAQFAPKQQQSVKLHEEDKEATNTGARPKQRDERGQRCSWDDDKAHEICIGELRGKCKYGDGCMRLHGKFPYQWQYMADRWTNFSDVDNQVVEKAFSDPSTDGFLMESFQRFSTLTVTSDCHHNYNIRRMSTRSTVSCDSSFLEPYCIEWQWYWQDEYGTWTQYAQKSQKGSHSLVNGDELEVAYESYLCGEGPSVFQFETQKHKYELDFVAMVQKNLVYQTQRPVLRRPKLPSMAERKQIASQLHQQEKNFGSKNVPKMWDTKGMRPNQPMLVPLDIGRHGEEYTKVADMFKNTMDTNGMICAVKRVQNSELWQLYSVKKQHMRTKNKGSVVEKQLWHGTSKESSEAISRQNFDFRISGSNVGTLYGQGSYFASNAKYSDGYTKPENHIRRMFLARVLIGRFVKGEQSYKRPPPINPNNHLGDLYDSCVNDEADPSIYVTFDKSQAYPEYLIEYKRSSDISSSSTVPNTPVPKPRAPMPTPSPWNSGASASRSYPSYNSSTSVSTNSNPYRNSIRINRSTPGPAYRPIPPSRSSSSTSSASASVRSSSSFGMGHVSPSAPVGDEDDIISSVIRSTLRSMASDQSPSHQNSSDNKKCCIQ